MGELHPSAEQAIYEAEGVRPDYTYNLNTHYDRYIKLDYAHGGLKAVVESKIESAINKSKKLKSEGRISDWYIQYKLTPLFGTVPDYIQRKIDSTVNPVTKDAASKWLNQATPKEYKADWRHVVHVDGANPLSTKGFEESFTLPADVGA